MTPEERIKAAAKALMTDEEASGAIFLTDEERVVLLRRLDGHDTALDYEPGEPSFVSAERAFWAALESARRKLSEGGKA